MLRRLLRVKGGTHQVRRLLRTFPDPLDAVPLLFQLPRRQASRHEGERLRRGSQVEKSFARLMTSRPMLDLIYALQLLIGHF